MNRVRLMLHVEGSRLPIDHWHVVIEPYFFSSWKNCSFLKQKLPRVSKKFQKSLKKSLKKATFYPIHPTRTLIHHPIHFLIYFIPSSLQDTLLSSVDCFKFAKIFFFSHCFETCFSQKFYQAFPHQINYLNQQLHYNFIFQCHKYYTY